MKASESGASSATAAPSEETPKAAVPSEAQLSLDIEIILRSRFVVTVMLS